MIMPLSPFTIVDRMFGRLTTLISFLVLLALLTPASANADSASTLQERINGLTSTINKRGSGQSCYSVQNGRPVAATWNGVKENLYCQQVAIDLNKFRIWYDSEVKRISAWKDPAQKKLALTALRTTYTKFELRHYRFNSYNTLFLKFKGVYFNLGSGLYLYNLPFTDIPNYPNDLAARASAGLKIQNAISGYLAYLGMYEAGPGSTRPSPIYVFSQYFLQPKAGSKALAQQRVAVRNFSRAADGYLPGKARSITFKRTEYLTRLVILCEARWNAGNGQLLSLVQMLNIYNSGAAALNQVPDRPTLGASFRGVLAVPATDIALAQRAFVYDSKTKKCKAR